MQSLRQGQPRTTRNASQDHIYSAVASLQGRDKIGQGDCVELVRSLVPTLRDRPTRAWVQGDKVTDVADQLKPGTAIATFLCGRYPQDSYTGKHAALFVGVKRRDANGKVVEIVIMDQWKSKRSIGSRPLRLRGTPGSQCNGGRYDASNKLEDYYVIR